LDIDIILSPAPGTTATYNSRVLPLAHELAKKGFKVRIITTSVDYHNLREKTIENKGVLVSHCAQFQYKLRNMNSKREYLTLLQILKETLRFLTKVFKIINQDNPRVVLIFTGNLLSLLSYPLIKLIKIYKRFKIISDYDDIFGKGGYSEVAPYKFKSVIVFIMDVLEKTVPLLADEHVVCSHYLQKRFYYSSPQIIPNSVDCSRFKKPQKTKKNNKVRAVFIGRITPQHWYDIRTIVEAISLLNRKKNISPDKFEVLIIGTGDRMGDLKALIEEKNVEEYFKLLGWIDSSKISYYLSSSDIGLLPLSTNPINAARCPVKLLEYMASGLAIVTSNFGEPSHILEYGWSGILTKPNSTNSFANGIRLLVDDLSLREKIRKNALIKSGYFDHKNVVRKWLEVIK